MKKDFLKIKDLTKEEIYKIFDITKYFKSLKKEKKITDHLKNLTIGLLFSKPSTRTRLSFEVAIFQLGGFPIYLASESTQISRGESIKDTARVISKYIDGIIIRTYSQEEIEEFARYSEIPVINALTDLYHPVQILSDFFTIYEKKGTFENLKITYIGDGNNICNSLIEGCDLLGIEIRVSCPDEYRPEEKIIKNLINKNILKISSKPDAFIEDADIIYTDTWVSMGDELEKEKRFKIFQKYQVNRNLLKKAKKDFLFMHCLPAHRGEEVVDEVIDGPNSIVIEQAENRLHTQKGLLCFIFEKI
ncbi:MAG: ornithine carbamoyltransferase [Candidatus Omnitrophica bacterium]|nr:ornithine carbamoyltransferase [Candidatus Omnitrophota bacterium]MCM8810468.1 ornithine carbamoyltransferase [Candidatus Omnitrophota bacterium]MCM8832960.1 ornithine carbamoyltransferase [Candidatus Omnitrophota bacterium]